MNKWECIAKRYQVLIQSFWISTACPKLIIVTAKYVFKKLLQKINLVVQDGHRNLPTWQIKCFYYSNSQGSRFCEIILICWLHQSTNLEESDLLTPTTNRCSQCCVLHLRESLIKIVAFPSTTAQSLFCCSVLVICIGHFPF